MQRCSVRDTSAFSLRLYLRAHVEVDRCHLAYSMSGILLQDRCSLDLTMSRVEKVWFGAGVSALGHSKMSMVRCDLRQCSFGLVLHESAAVSMSYSAVINCTYAAFHQMEQEENENEARQGDRGLGNSCCLNLTGNSIYSSLSHMAWWDNTRPRVLVQEKNLFEDDDQPAISVGLLSASIRESVCEGPLTARTPATTLNPTPTRRPQVFAASVISTREEVWGQDTQQPDSLFVRRIESEDSDGVGIRSLCCAGCKSKESTITTCHPRIPRLNPIFYTRTEAL